MHTLRVLVDGVPRYAHLDPADPEHLTLLDEDPFAAASLASPASARLVDDTGPRPASATGPRLALAGLRVLAPCTPSKILGVGLNYRAHAREMGKPLPEEPLLFMKPPSAVIASGAPIVRPRAPGVPYSRVDFEGELAVVIGRRARGVSVERALDYAYGYTICNDVTVRELQKKDVQFTRAKGFDGFCPLGPVIASAASLSPDALRLATVVRRADGTSAMRQHSSTEDMVFSVAHIIAFASSVMTLFPGDVITTGTPPGVGNLAAGDVVAITIEGIGTLENPVIEEPEYA